MRRSSWPLCALVRAARACVCPQLSHTGSALCALTVREDFGFVHNLQVFFAARALYFIRANTAFVHSLHVTAAHCKPYAFHLCWDYPQLAGLFCGSRTLLHSSNTAFVHSLHVPAAHCALDAIRPCWDYPQLAGLFCDSRLLLHSRSNAFVHILYVPAAHCAPDAIHPR